MSDLKPCPFCGKQDCGTTDEGDFYVECYYCAARGEYKATAAEAIAAWNQRTDPLRDAVVEAAVALAKNPGVTEILAVRRAVEALEAEGANP